MSFVTEPYEALEWVTVETGERSESVAVRCEVCGAVEALYLTVLAADHAALRRAVEKHARCRAWRGKP